MVGIYPSIEVVVVDDKGNFYLKRRAPEENASEAEHKSWTGKLHLPGCTVAPAGRLERDFYNLLEREVVRGEGSSQRRTLAELYRGAETLGVYLSFLPERNTNVLTVLMEVKIDPKDLREGFEKIDENNENNMSQIIDQHKRIIPKLLNRSRRGPFIYDTRK